MISRSGTRRCWRWLAAALLAVSVFAARQAPAETRTSGLIAAGTKWATPYHVVDSGRDGPTVMITGGAHGNEPAGARAAEHIRHWPPLRGKLIVVPRLNPPGLAGNTRYMPGESKELRNLNRNFPKTGKPDEARGAAAGHIWAFVKARKPDWLLDLHEGYDFHNANKKSVGASIIHLSELKLAGVVKLMLDAVNATVDDEDKKLVSLRGAADGSLARAAAQRLKTRAMILETCFKKQYVSLRARQHRIMVHRLLKHLEMVDCDVDLMTPAAAARAIRPVHSDGALHVGIYNGSGTGNSTGLRLEKILHEMPGVVTRLVGPAEIRAGVLKKQFDVVIFGGGSGSGQARTIGAGGRKAVKEFVQAGGGYLGICGGAYLGTSAYTWGLRIVDAHTVDRQHWKRGTGTVRIEMTPLGRQLLAGADGLTNIYFANGPLLGPHNMDELPDYRTLAHYRTEMRKNDAPEGVMLNTPAMIVGECGGGRAILFSPHPEKTDGLHHFVRRAVLHVARRSLTAAPPPGQKAQ